MFSMCSEHTPRARIPDTRIPQLMQPWSRVSFQISSKIAIHLFEKIIKYIGGWNIEQMLLDYDYHPLNGQMMRSI